jgi:hypothetical protein
MNILRNESFCPQKKMHNRTLLFGSILKNGRLKPASEHEHARLQRELSWSWIVLLPSDIHRKPIPLQMFYFHLWLIYWCSLTSCSCRDSNLYSSGQSFHSLLSILRSPSSTILGCGRLLIFASAAGQLGVGWALFLFRFRKLHNPALVQVLVLVLTWKDRKHYWLQCVTETQLKNDNLSVFRLYMSIYASITV